MIFLTVGSDLPFNRLTKEFDSWCKTHPKWETLAQVGELGHDDFTPTATKWVSEMAPADYDAAIARATLVVAHAGMGSILTAQVTAKPIVILPRRAALAETRSDHQVATAKFFSESSGIFVAWETLDLAGEINRALEVSNQMPFNSIAPLAPESLTVKLRDFIQSARS